MKNMKLKYLIVNSVGVEIRVQTKQAALQVMREERSKGYGVKMYEDKNGELINVPVK